MRTEEILAALRRLKVVTVTHWIPLPDGPEVE